ncbi:integral membrane protein [Colletotrichum cuscutae]|uniref:Integral membrane protein n=1 Tax=Colletotrichum cuscutae TaxID=1209917 RepID=A0AAJ0DMD1_9PEZI|nr:integral membrane protein [Colletotrichum cuscutae]
MRSPLMWTVAGGGSANFASKDEEGEDSLGGCAKRGMGCWIRYLTFTQSAKATNPVTLYTVGQVPACLLTPLSLIAVSIVGCLFRHQSVSQSVTRGKKEKIQEGNMGIGAVAEPLVVITLLFGGTWFNRNIGDTNAYDNLGWKGAGLDDAEHKRSDEHRSGNSTPDSEESLLSLGAWSSSSTLTPQEEPPRRCRRIKFFGYQRIVTTPNTRVYKDRLLSRVLRKFPFLVEAWYWALIYWVYQVGRAFTALTLNEGTVDVARKHALQLIHLEQRLHVFIEVPVQQYFLQMPTVMHWINRIYSFIHIPGTILFLVILYFITTTRKRRAVSAKLGGNENIRWNSAGPALYEARRRTMATCNLLAFVVFTLWPCMPPRLLSDPNYNGPDAGEAKSFGFVDTVHSSTGESSVWTTNKFCNQYAAMPSLHFGYSLLIGLTVATLPLPSIRSRPWKRFAIVAVGMAYPALILTAIVATANHFVLDAVAGAIVCGLAWNCNGVLLNLLVVEDYFLRLLRIHKPVNWTDPEATIDTNEWKPSTVLDEI